MTLRLLLGLLLAAAVLITADLWQEPGTTVTYRTINDWGSGRIGEFQISNPTTNEVDDWLLAFRYPAQISSMWGGNIRQHEGDVYIISAAAWNAKIASGGTSVVGFQAEPGGIDPGSIRIVTGPFQSPRSTTGTAEKACLPTWPQAPPARSMTTFDSGPVRLGFAVLGEHGDYLDIQFSIRNRGWRSLRNWTLFLNYPVDLTDMQGARVTARAGGNYRIDSPKIGPNAVIPPRGVITFTARVGLAGRFTPPRRVVFRGAEGSIAPLYFNYAEALQKSLFFYEAQRSGKLPADNRVSWRGDSALRDGATEGVDLTGGYYDAGDHVKFALPMCYTLTMLAWGGIEYRPGFEKAGQWKQLLDTLRWGTDWLMKAHVAPEELYGQVGLGEEDHLYWGSAETMKMNRPAFKITRDKPGSDLAGEAAAALAASSILFQSSDPEYAKRLIQHAEELFRFAADYPGKYSDHIPDAAAFYPSSGYGDELAWAATWLYCATRQPDYLGKAQRYYEQYVRKNIRYHSHSWDNKGPGTAILMARLTMEEKYKKDAELFLDFWTRGRLGERIEYTPGGLAWLNGWGSLRYSATTAFLALVYSDAVRDPDRTYRYFACRQIDYILGDNPARRSYVVGFGANPPRNPHHRSAHGSITNDIETPYYNRHILYGALVGGPEELNDLAFHDERRNLHTNEVALDYNAGFTGALARMVMIFGGRPLKNFPPR